VSILQTISSLLKLQVTHVSHEQVRDLLTMSQGRVRAIALGFDRSRLIAGAVCVDLAPYLRAIASQLVSERSTEQRSIRLQVDCPSVMVDLDTAIPLGLIAHELVSNALRYAFLGRSEGMVRIGLRQGTDHIELEIADDGVGFPASFCWQEAESLGSHIVRGLARQLHGTVELSQEAETVFTLRAPVGIAST
jgi:two-component sensor histidine kinase